MKSGSGFDRLFVLVRQMRTSISTRGIADALLKRWIGRLVLFARTHACIHLALRNDTQELVHMYMNV